MIAMPLVLFTLVACNGRDKETGTDDTAETADTSETGDTTDTTETDTGTPTGFTISGTGVDLGGGVPIDGTGLTIVVADPTPALAGGEMEVLAVGTIEADGSFTVAGIETTSTVGLFVVTTGPGVMNSASGVSVESYSDLGDGDTLADTTAYVVTDALVAGVNGSIAAVGGAHDINKEGALFGFVLDVNGAPVAGATAGCAGCGTPDFYYADGNPKDGLFGVGPNANVSTNAAARSMFVVPAGPIASYNADDGGVHDFPSQLGGSLPTFAAFIAITALD
jgi:hypothetical protein